MASWFGDQKRKNQRIKIIHAEFPIIMKGRAYRKCEGIDFEIITTEHLYFLFVDDRTAAIEYLNKEVV